MSAMTLKYHFTGTSKTTLKFADTFTSTVSMRTLFELTSTSFYRFITFFMPAMTVKCNFRPFPWRATVWRRHIPRTLRCFSYRPKCTTDFREMRWLQCPTDFSAYFKWWKTTQGQFQSTTWILPTRQSSAGLTFILLLHLLLLKMPGPMTLPVNINTVCI